MQLEDLLRSKGISLSRKLAIVNYLHHFPNNSIETALEFSETHVRTKPLITELGILPLGNLTIEGKPFKASIWTRYLFFMSPTTVHEGHSHHFDHVFLCTSGELELHREGYSPMRIGPGGSVLVPKEAFHHLVAKEPNSAGICMTLLQDDKGELTEFYDNQAWKYATNEAESLPNTYNAIIDQIKLVHFDAERKLNKIKQMQKLNKTAPLELEMQTMRVTVLNELMTKFKIC